MPPERSKQELRRAAKSVAIMVVTLFLIVTFVVGAALVGPAIIQTAAKSPPAHSSSQPAALVRPATHHRAH